MVADSRAIDLAITTVGTRDHRLLHPLPLISPRTWPKLQYYKGTSPMCRMIQRVATISLSALVAAAAAFLALTFASEAFATVDVLANGSGAAGPSYYSYSTSGAATVAGATSASNFGINASFGSKASIGVLKAYGHIDAPK